MCVKHDILAALSYFDIFDYPITQSEISQFLGNTYAQEDSAEALYQLIAENWIFKLDEFYSLQDNYALVVRRRNGNIRAKEMLKTAEKVAAFLSSFPFVRGIAISGSLSKNFADENSDIDFFIITQKNRLWLARTFMHIFKKFTFLFRKQDWFCMNYYIDEEMLQIKEKNIFTATEVVTLLPLRGIAIFRDFFAKNKWSHDFLPNHSLRVSLVQKSKNSVFKKIIEFAFKNVVGNLIDIVLMKLTTKRWLAKTESKMLNKRGLVSSMDSSRHYSKPSPEVFQYKLLDTYERKISEIFTRYESRAKTVF